MFKDVKNQSTYSNKKGYSCEYANSKTLYSQFTYLLAPFRRLVNEKSQSQINHGQMWLFVT